MNELNCTPAVGFPAISVSRIIVTHQSYFFLCEERLPTVISMFKEIAFPLFAATLTM